MNYETFAAILNRRIFHEARRDLFRKLSENPERFIGLFRPAKPQSKLFQHVFQTHEIKFGNAMEDIVGEFLKLHGYQLQGKYITADLECDLYFFSPEEPQAFLIEQKVRDDHDSTKRRGQWENFEKKVRVLVKRHGGNLTAVLYFVDPSLHKNRKFYQRKIDWLRDALSLPSIYLWYGQELFEQLMTPDDWQLLLDWLKRWRLELPVLPDLNWEEPEALTELLQIAQDEPKLWLRFAQCDALWDEGVVDVLFPTREGLRAILMTLQSLEGRMAKRAATALQKRLGI